MSHLSRKTISSSATTVKEESNNEVLDLRKSNAVEKVCFWCGKQGTLTENGVEKFCSEICFDQFRRDSFKKRTTCIWCNNLSQGALNVNQMSNLDETKFCSDNCLTQFKLRLFCEETSTHLDKIKDGSLSVSMHGFPMPTSTDLSSPSESTTGASSDSSLAVKDLITPDLWLKTSTSMKPFTPLKVSSPFQGSNKPVIRRISASSGSPPIASVSQSPVNDVVLQESSAANVNIRGDGRGFDFMTSIPEESPNVATNYTNALSWMLSSSHGNPRTMPCKNVRRDNSSAGGLLRKRMKSSNCSVEPQCSIYSKAAPKRHNLGMNLTQQCEIQKGANTSFNANKTRNNSATGNKKQRGNQNVYENTVISSGNSIALAKAISPTPDVNIPNAIVSPWKLAYGGANKLISNSQNLINNNEYSKINFRGLELALGGQIAGYLPNFLHGDDNESIESSSSGSVNSQAVSSIIQKESFTPTSKYSNGTSNNFGNRYSFRASPIMTEAETQTDGSSPMLPEFSFSSLSKLPSTTILVPFPFAVPIPVPIPIIINAGGLQNNGSRLPNLKETNVCESACSKEKEMSFISNQHPINNDFTAPLNESMETTSKECSRACTLGSTIEDDRRMIQEVANYENVKMEEMEEDS